MSLTLQEQLSSVPIPRLTTVLRLNFALLRHGSSYERVISLIQDWWNQKAKPYDARLDATDNDFSLNRGRFKAELARTENQFAFAMEEPDSSVSERDWLCNFALRRNAEQTDFAVRVSYRQPHNLQIRPDPRAPRFLRDIVEAVGAVDCRKMESIPRNVGLEDLGFFEDLVQARSRTLPVIAISEEALTRKLLVDPNKLARLLSGAAHVLKLDEQASWQLSRDWGTDWSTFQGAVRCYNQGFDRSGDKFRHRLWLPQTIGRLDAAARDGFLNACCSHVFTQINAYFEPLSLPTPSAVRRSMQEALVLVSRTQPETAQPDSRLIFAPARSPVPPPVDDFKVLLHELRNQLEKEALEKAELSARFIRIVSQLKESEAALEQERSGRSESERAREEAEGFYSLLKAEYDELNTEHRIILGDSTLEPSPSLRPLWESFHSFYAVVSNVATQFRRLEADSTENLYLTGQLQEANQTIINLEARVDSLEQRTGPNSSNTGTADAFRRSQIIAILPDLIQRNPRLETILRMVEAVLPERVVILNSAYDSAGSADSFKYGIQAFELLWLLVTKYWSVVREHGDTEARKVFGSSYAARESNTLSKAGQDCRTFLYQGKPLLMEKHLKIGVADNASETLRVHFEWHSDEARIIVGHCGRHLDF